MFDIQNNVIIKTDIKKITSVNFSTALCMLEVGLQFEYFFYLVRSVTTPNGVIKTNNKKEIFVFILRPHTDTKAFALKVLERRCSNKIIPTQNNGNAMKFGGQYIFVELPNDSIYDVGDVVPNGWII